MVGSSGSVGPTRSVLVARSAPGLGSHTVWFRIRSLFAMPADSDWQTSQTQPPPRSLAWSRGACRGQPRSGLSFGVSLVLRSTWPELWPKSCLGANRSMCHPPPLQLMSARTCGMKCLLWPLQRQHPRSSVFFIAARVSFRKRFGQASLGV